MAVSDGQDHPLWAACGLSSDSGGGQKATFDSFDKNMNTRNEKETDAQYLFTKSLLRITFFAALICPRPFARCEYF
ncbi:hypothetical protein GGD40_006456 [Paraburkholderia bryophila]|uniref:Uncharacterized protein n=1 Tax=Paraburkholderia bryophila TaxID=420952 RepID=A0A7Z0BBH3_9BURK|nr:hypothetical protein [Paraburkholderia bryophila]